MQLVGILSKVSYTCHQLQLVRHSSPTLLPHLNISAASHLSEILLLLQGFVNLVICHAEAAQSGLNGIVGLGKYDKLGHIWDTDDLSVHLSGEIDRFLDLSTVYQPEQFHLSTPEKLSCCVRSFQLLDHQETSDVLPTCFISTASHYAFTPGETCPPLFLLIYFPIYEVV